MLPTLCPGNTKSCFSAAESVVISQRPFRFTRVSSEKSRWTGAGKVNTWIWVNKATINLKSIRFHHLSTEKVISRLCVVLDMHTCHVVGGQHESAKGTLFPTEISLRRHRRSSICCREIWVSSRRKRERGYSYDATFRKCKCFRWFRHL